MVPSRATVEGVTQVGALGAATRHASIDADVGLGDHLGAGAMQAAQTVGVAASVAVSAPITVFESTMRRSIGEQVERLGRAAGNALGSAVSRSPEPLLQTHGIERPPLEWVVCARSGMVPPEINQWKSAEKDDSS